jgi:hydroxyacylglutathione hydrolase
VVGYLDGGMQAWADLPVQKLQQVTVQTLHEQLESSRDGRSFLVLDVRDPGEWDEGHIKGAIHIPYYSVEQRLQELDRTRPMVVTCASGQRSTLACSVLQKHGFAALSNVVGGMDAWNDAGFETIS